MLEKSQLVQIFDNLSTPRRGSELILKARVAAPVRKVKSHGSNVITLFSSKKMGQEIATESRHIEFAAAVDKEYDPLVLEYYAQPCELKLELTDFATGEIRNVTHFPDFLVITAKGFVLEEWKSSLKLSRLAERYPYRYTKGSDDRWMSPQIERQLLDMGIGYRICTDEDIPRKRVENYLHLADYFHQETEPGHDGDVARLHAALNEHGVLFINELCSHPYDFSADTIFQAIADNEVVADLDRETLTNPRRSRLYRDKTLREFLAGEVRVGAIPGQDKFVFEISVGAVFQYESQEFTISIIGEQKIVCTANDGQPVNLTRDWIADALLNEKITPVSSPHTAKLNLTRHSQENLDAALHRQAILQCDKKQLTVSDRTIRRWLAKQNAAVANGGNEILALTPNTSARGNRCARLSDEQEEALSKIINETWRTHHAQNYKSCYRKLREHCELAGIRTPAYPTLIARIKAEETNHDVRIRHGKRMAYQQNKFVDVLYLDTPANGSRPFQYVHIDHTQIDIELISSRTGRPMGRPWLSLAVDAWSRRIVAFHLTFDPPSYHSVLMTVRDMVRRFNRLPEFIVVDNGKDFQSTAFESFLQVMGVHLRFRPAGQPRHGAVLERLFGRMHTEYIHNLAGNTKATKNVRMTTGKHLPVNFAEWTLESMYWGIEHWATEYYEQERHPALDDTPRATFLRGLKESGARGHKHILCNQDFMIATCPPVDRVGTRKVHSQRGVKVNDLQYWASEFRDAKVADKDFPVRYDPWDASSVYVRLKDRWVRAICKNLRDLGQLTEMERRALTVEYEHKTGESVKDEKSQQRLREFMQVFKPEGAIQDALERQQENKSLYNTLELGAISPGIQPRKISLTQEISESAHFADNRTSLHQPLDAPYETPAFESLPNFEDL